MPVPGLLVSVRNVDEAKQVAGNAVQIIDVKEPRRGSLGRANQAELVSISNFFRHTNANPGITQSTPDRATSVALGEVVEFSRYFHEDFFEPWARQFCFAKFGLAHVGTGNRWWKQWEDCLQTLPGHIGHVAVAYADHDSCDSPDPEQILEIGSELGCRAFLIDTYHKSGSNLFDYCNTHSLSGIVYRARALGLITVLAGSINVDCLRHAVQCQPDYIGVRGAVCNANRTSEVCPRKLVAFKKLLESFEDSRPV